MMPIDLTSINPLQSKIDEMTTSARQTVATHNVPTTSDDSVPQAAKTKKKNDEFKTQIASTKEYRRKLIRNWSVSIDYRRGKPFTSQTDEDQVAVNLDWSMTKAKQAALFSQIPQIRLEHSDYTDPAKNPWVSKYQYALNDALLEAGIEATMDECLPDCINAAGIGVAIVSYESITEDRQVPVSSSPDETEPAQDPTESTDLGDQEPADPNAQGEPGVDSPAAMETIPFPIDHRYLVQRVSPSDFLWPIKISVSNFDNGPWIGRSGRIPWAEAVQKWKLSEDDKDTILGDDKPLMDRLTQDVERDKTSGDEMVGFDELFYREFQYDSEAKSYSAIHHLVFVNGKEDPVIDEPWRGQKLNPDGSLIGAQRFPIRVLTLAYLTDESIPPSDSSIGRPQVNEINRGRSQMIQQRQRSLPVRTVDINRLDPAIMQSLLRGTWQAFIPVQGDGSRIINEVSRSNMPQENFLFDKIAKSDYLEQMTLSHIGQDVKASDKDDPNQNKSPYNSQIGRERAKVASFVAGIAEVLGGLMALYEDPANLGEGFDPSISKKLKCSILVDSTVLLDASQKLERLNQFINTYAKSGWINVEPVLQEIATLTGLDPSEVVKAPEPKPPVEPNISLRLTGVEDMLNPLALAFLIKSGQAPPPEMIEQAKQLIQQAVTPPPNMQLQPGQPAPGGAPMLPGQDGQPLPPGGSGAPQPDPSQGMATNLPPNVPPPQPGGPVPKPAPPQMGEAHPQWTSMTHLDKRTDGGQK